MKLYITVTLPLRIETFEMDTSVNPELPWQEFIEKLKLHKYLDKHYEDWQGYDINIDEEEISDSKQFFKKQEVPVEEEVDD